MAKAHRIVQLCKNYFCVKVIGVVVAEIITLYLVQMGRFLATTGYAAPSPNHVENNVQEIIMYLNVSSHQGKENTHQDKLIGVTIGKLLET